MEPAATLHWLHGDGIIDHFSSKQTFQMEVRTWCDHKKNTCRVGPIGHTGIVSWACFLHDYCEEELGVEEEAQHCVGKVVDVRDPALKPESLR